MTEWFEFSNVKSSKTLRFEFSNVKSSKTLSFDLVAEVYGLIYPPPSGEEFQFC